MSGRQYLCPHCSAAFPTKPTTKGHKRCGGVYWITRQGWYVVVPWRADGRYRLADAVSRHTSQTVADRRASLDPSLVVRFITEEPRP